MRWLGVSAMAMACAGANPDAGRQAWMVNQLLSDDKVWLDRDPSLVATKWAVMAADPYDFMRGSLGMWARDLARPGADRPTFGFLDVPTVRLLVGDPHPENFGTFLPASADPSTELAFEVNDLDAAAYGTWSLDVRRGALGLTLMVDVAPCDTCAAVAVDAYARAYADAVSGVGQAGIDGCGAIVSSLAASVREDIASHHTLTKDTTAADQLIREPLDDAGKGMLDLTDGERGQVSRLFAQLVAAEGAPSGLRLRDAVRRYGRGIASLPAIRYLWLIDRGQDGTADDELIQVREVVDPPTMPGVIRPVDGEFADPESRVAMASRLLWPSPDLDPWLAALSDDGPTFKVQAFGDAFLGLDHVDVAESIAAGEVGAGDATDLGRCLGARLGGTHRRAPGLGPRDGTDAISDALAGRVDVFADEVVRAAQVDAARVVADRALLATALEHDGPLLGADDVFAEEGTW